MNRGASGPVLPRQRQQEKEQRNRLETKSYPHRNRCTTLSRGGSNLDENGGLRFRENQQKQLKEGVTLSLASNGGEIEWIANSLLQMNINDALKFINHEYLEIRNRYPDEFDLMANAHALDESCRPIVEEMLHQHGAKAIAVASSYGDGAQREFLDSPKAEWLWQLAEANKVLVHIHPPMESISHGSLTQYRLNEAVGRPYDSTVDAARMVSSGLFDRYRELQVLVFHMGGDLCSILGRLDFCWRLNYNESLALQRKRSP